jgi:hypothetical protein
MSGAAMLRGAALALFAIHTSAVAAEERIAFLGCPIVRDTPTVPCWLAEYEGETYFLGIQTDVSAPFSPPSLGNKVLVEGEKTNEPRVCGGIPIKNVIVSVLPERAEQCNTLLMADDRFPLTFESPRPPGPSRGRLAFTYPEPEKLAKPFQPRDFEIHYDYDAGVSFRHPRFLMLAMDYAEKVKAKSIIIRGYRAQTVLSNGEVMTERSGIAEKRAKEAADLLQGAGLKSPKYQVTWDEEPKSGDHTQRRVVITVNP